MFCKFSGTFRQSLLPLVEVSFSVVQFTLLDFQPQCPLVKHL